MLHVCATICLKCITSERVNQLKNVLTLTLCYLQLGHKTKTMQGYEARIHFLLTRENAAQSGMENV